jgi:hypothetical protein
MDTCDFPLQSVIPPLVMNALNLTLYSKLVCPCELKIVPLVILARKFPGIKSAQEFREIVWTQRRRFRKVFSVYALRAYRGSRGTTALILNLSNIWEWLTSSTGRFTPKKEPWYSLNSRLGGTHSRSGHF